MSNLGYKSEDIIKEIKEDSRGTFGLLYEKLWKERYYKRPSSSYIRP